MDPPLRREMWVRFCYLVSSHQLYRTLLVSVKGSCRDMFLCLAIGFFKSFQYIHQFWLAVQKPSCFFKNPKLRIIIYSIFKEDNIIIGEFNVSVGSYDWDLDALNCHDVGEINANELNETLIMNSNDFNLLQLCNQFELALVTHSFLKGLWAWWLGFNLDHTIDIFWIILWLMCR